MSASCSRPTIRSSRRTKRVRSSITCRWPRTCAPTSALTMRRGCWGFRRKVGKIASHRVYSYARPARNFAHAVAPRDLTAWATRRYAVPLFEVAVRALPTLRAALWAKYYCMHDAPRQEREHPGDHQRADEERHHSVAMLEDLVTVRMPDRDRQNDQCEDGEQVDRAPWPPQPDLVDEEGAHAHHGH